ncbi:DEAD/DEAH box helicase [Secundilactobacillus kimchicus]|uniref:Superfamily II DNA RNA helicase n=1 Tax=Secundilactobacillus kimchicus JCM 15530 TaxID=1302272 RepID=A0A0R1HRS8_9LACO|nr:DEAD/DEAH box helicase [Secundilactobacillus kimchicus]KRK49003.1 superfamily II DNA RNA helicase [Secundilactobacillus kimchicus JCM 15530]MBT9671799.1 DEAD/DEAH box helicase [Secundilactobacillus kimchicus]
MITEFQQRFEKLGFSQLSPIQEAVYQPLLDGDSVLGLAPTGSGKTLGFVLPMLEKMTPGDGIQAMIVAPSQELAMQLTNVARTFADLVNLKVTAITGGANVKRQMEQLKKHPDLIVGTPGRIQNLIDDRRLKVAGVKTVIIDEADDLLEGETFDTVRWILQAVPGEVQLGFFSATETPQLTGESLEKWFGQPVTRYDVRAIDQTQGAVRHGLLTISNLKKNVMLRRLAEMKQFKGLVFFDNVAGLQKTASWLRHNHVAAATLTANQRQTERQKALTDFRLGRIKLLLSTDVAARGLDIAKLPAVVNYDLPSTANGYTHRAGRTGRMGEPGQVINFGNDHDFRDLKRLLVKTDLNLVPIAYQDRQLVAANEATDQAPTVTAKRVSAGGVPATSSTPTERTVTRPAAPVEPTAKKKHKNKHSKRKGMRHKRQQQN